MARDVVDATPIGSRDELIRWFEAGEKPRSAWRLGTEHEKVPFYKHDASPVPYEGERGIRALLDGMAALNGWEPIIEGAQPIGLAAEAAGAAGRPSPRRPF